MKTVRVLQLGAEDFSVSMQVSECAEWNYEPDFSELPKRDFDVVILDREVTEDEFDYLIRFTKAYGLFLMEAILPKKGDVTRQLFIRKMGKRISARELEILLRDDLPDYFLESYGEKYKPQDMSVAQGFKGSVFWRGIEGVDLDGDYGNELVQIIFWQNNIPIDDGPIEFWLEYKKDATVEISLEIQILQFKFGTIPTSQSVQTFSENELNDIVYIENKSGNLGYVFASLKAKGQGKLTITALHDRHSRRGKGNFIPGGKRVVTSEREEIFYYFDPGNLKPPLNVYFSGYKTQEGFEGYNMMRKLGHPFLLISESRLEGGSLYLGTKEFENAMEQIIRKCMRMLKFQNSEVILSGLSMGTFGALYYGCRIRPNTILLGKPLASLGDLAENMRIKNSDGSNFSVDVLHKEYGSLDRKAIEQLNSRFWSLFDRTDWSKTRFAVAYMIEDDCDGNAYKNLQSHLRGDNAWIYGKGLHGRHNDNTPGIVSWFRNQYQEIIQRDFEKVESKMGGRKR